MTNPKFKILINKRYIDELFKENKNWCLNLFKIKSAVL